MTSQIRIAEALACERSNCPCAKAVTSSKGNLHCPAHSDPRPSLSVTEDGEKVLVHCHAGCAQEAVITALRKLGLWQEPRRKGDHRPKARANALETRYEVRDVDGRLVAIHVRKDSPSGKKMWWEQPDGTKELNGMPASGLPLYGAEDLQTLPDGSQVVVTEGESARDALRALGIPAVGTVTGAGDTPGSDALKLLTRLRPILWADNDEPGHPHMNRIAVRLSSLGCSTVGIVNWPEAPHKGDAVDAVELGVDIHQLIATAQPWKPGNIDLAALLNDLAAFLRRYVVLTDHQQRALALWVAHTHAIDAADCTPYILIQSAEKRSGKTLLLEILGLLVARAWNTGRVTKGALVRKIARLGPTLLLDETDAAFNGPKEFSEAIRGVLNAGYLRGGVDSICVQVNGEWVDRDFPVFCAKALSGIGTLPDTIQDRGIRIEMRRKAKREKTEKFRRKKIVLNAAPLAETLVTWADEAAPVLEPAEPDIPEELGDRAADVWEPLLAIADLAGGEWPAWARQSAVALSGRSVQEDDSLGVTLLTDIYKVFTARKVDRLFSTDLASELAHIEESSWGDVRGKPLNASGLAQRLKSFDIKPKQIRIGESSFKGYLMEWFLDAWERYTTHIGETPETPKQNDHFEPNEASEDVSASNLASETEFPAEPENRAYVSAVSGVSAPGDIGALGEYDAEVF